MILIICLIEDTVDSMIDEFIRIKDERQSYYVLEKNELIFPQLVDLATKLSICYDYIIIESNLNSFYFLI